MFGISDPDLPIQYTTFMGLRNLLMSMPLLSVLADLITRESLFLATGLG